MALVGEGLEPLDEVRVDELTDDLGGEPVRPGEPCLELLRPLGELGTQPLEALLGDRDWGDVGLGVHPVPAGKRPGESGPSIGKRVPGLPGNAFEGDARPLHDTLQRHRGALEGAVGHENEGVYRCEPQPVSHGGDHRVGDPVGRQLIGMDETPETDGPGVVRNNLTGQA